MTVLQPGYDQRPPQIIVIGGQKGGTGKTTLGLQLLLMAALSGLKVLAVDADRANGMSAVLSNRRSNDDIALKITGVQKLVPSGHDQRKGAKAFARDLIDLAGDYDLIVVDTAGYDAEDRKNLEFRGALLVADALLIVSRPGYLDRRVLPAVWSMVEDARDTRAEMAGEHEPDPLDVHCILNSVPTNPFQRAHDIQQAREIIATDVPDLAVSNHTVANRSIYYRGQEVGLLAMDQRPNSKERTELMSFYEVIMRQTFQREQKGAA
jgi:chromosome partitioning protein